MSDSTDDTDATELREAYRASSLYEAHLVAGLMQQAEISVMLRNADVFSASGALPSLSVLPSLWVRGESDYRRAREVVAEYETRLNSESDEQVADWKCGTCGEISPGNFDECWQCRGPRRPGSRT